ncbi:hypothetical protein Taro_037680 [Colocasia esculenta]|uniref:Uncharacterized protein n=1 Tax=Colocasia esculenta TaxID=4460 RepID=A0A843W4S5_COLES|nr:hypothetical protein [Colocasia esculenta]
MSKPQLFFLSYNRTPKRHGCLNTLNQTLGDEFTYFWGRVEEFLVAGKQEITHTKPFFFPFSSAATCTNRPLEVDQRCAVGWSPQFVGPVEVERQLDLTSVAARLRGSPVWFVQAERMILATYQLHGFAREWYAPYVVTDNAMMVEYFIRGLRL